MRFMDYALRRSIRENEAVAGAQPEQADGKAQEVAADFQQARTQLGGLLDKAFNTIHGQLQKSFGDGGSRVEAVNREKMAQALYKIADRLRSYGGVGEGGGAPAAAPAPSPAVAAEVHSYVRAIDKVLQEAEWHVEDVLEENEGAAPAPPKIRDTLEYLNSMKAKVMGYVDQILQTLQRDVLHQSLTNLNQQVGQIGQQVSGHGDRFGSIEKGVGELGGKVDGLSGIGDRFDKFSKEVGGKIGSMEKYYTKPPMNPKETEDAMDTLADIGRALGFEKRQFKGPRNTSMIDDVGVMSKKGSYLNFDPSDAEDMERALQNIDDPRAVRIKTGKGKEITVNLTNRQQALRIIDGLRTKGAGGQPFVPTPRGDDPAIGMSDAPGGGQIKSNNNPRLEPTAEPAPAPTQAPGVRDNPLVDLSKKTVGGATRRKPAAPRKPSTRKPKVTPPPTEGM